MICMTRWIVGAVVLMLPAGALAQAPLFPHQIVVDDTTVVRLEKISQPIVIGVSGMELHLDPAGSMRVSTADAWIVIDIDRSGKVHLEASSPIEPFPSVETGKKIKGVNRISFARDLRTGEIELLLGGGGGLGKEDFLIFPLVFKLATKGVRAIHKDRRVIKMRVET